MLLATTSAKDIVSLAVPIVPLFVPGIRTSRTALQRPGHITGLAAPRSQNLQSWLLLVAAGRSVNVTQHKPRLLGLTWVH
jgi:hypothetical protein